MEKSIILLLIFCSILLHTVAQEVQVSRYNAYLDSPILSLSLSDAKERLLSTSNDIDLGLVHFRIAFLSSEEDKVFSAFNYWDSLYKKIRYKNPLVLAYLGTLEAMYGGSISKGVFKKTKLAKAGMDKLTKAVKQIMLTDDNIAKSYVYFLRASTHSNLPTFFKAFKKDTLNNLKDAKKYLARSKASISNNLYVLLQANYNYTYGNWYAKEKKYSTAEKYYKKAISGLNNVSPVLTKTIEQARKKIGNKL